MKRSLHVVILYLIAGTFICGWWMMAFYKSSSSSSPGEYSVFSNPTEPLSSSLLPSSLSRLKRDTLHRALLGNYNLMIHLILNWDIDAQILEKKGLKGIQRLNPDQLLQAHMISRSLKTNKAKSSRFLPQTFAAATFLLALASWKEIIALPKGMHDLKHLYPQTLLKQIPDDSDLYQGEKLFITRPDLIFVSTYSNPVTIQVLRNQRLPFLILKGCENIDDIHEALLKMGQAMNRSLEAQLLSIFIEACLINLDNCFHTLGSSEKAKKILFLYYNQNFMQPTTKCLTGQLLNRALRHCSSLIIPITNSHNEWRIPFSQEKILQENPDYILISSPYPLAIQNKIENDPAIKSLNLQKILYLDEHVQESPTQYIVLAYFDLFQAIAHIYYL